MKDYSDLLQKYRELTREADAAFAQAQKEYPDQMKCYMGCSDCCYAVFGLFPIEVAYINQHFQQLGDKTKKYVLEQAQIADDKLTQVQEQLANVGDSPQTADKILSEARIRCPLLDGERKCYLYQHRPVTCRVYGMPTIIKGRVHACWQAGFDKDRPYPTFNLDEMYKELYELSGQLLERQGKTEGDRAALLYSLARSLTDPDL